jgi:hypothetical protein
LDLGDLAEQAREGDWAEGKGEGPEDKNIRNSLNPPKKKLRQGLKTRKIQRKTSPSVSKLRAVREPFPS